MSSALSGVPGFGFPRLDYGAAEFAEIITPAVTFAAAATLEQVVAQGKAGDALYINSVACSVITNATVSNRTAQLIVNDPDGNLVSIFPNPLTITASTVQTWQWSTDVANSYTAVGVGISPMQRVILLPGYSLVIQLQGFQIGDKITQQIASGVAIPTMGTPTADQELVARQLLT